MEYCFLGKTGLPGSRMGLPASGGDGPDSGCPQR